MSLSHRHCLLLAAASLLAACPATTLAADFSTVSEAVESVTSKELRQHVETLANDTFEGREAGSRGGRGIL